MSTLDYYTSVGSYPLFYLTADDECLCPECAEGRLQTAHDNGETAPSLSQEVSWESELTCDDCSEQLECAYSADEGMPAEDDC